MTECKKSHGRHVLLAVALWGMAMPLGAANITVKVQQVIVDTDRFNAVIEGLAITRLENKLTGEVYAGPSAGGAPTRAEAGMQAQRGVAIESLRPNVPVKYYVLCDKTRTTAMPTPDGGALVTHVGLQCGTGAQTDFAEKMSITLRVSLDAKTGDLLLAPEVKGNIELVHGVRDRGVLRAAMQLPSLANNLRFILPAGDGNSYTAADAPVDWINAAGRWGWPMAWEAALVIAESPKGCLAIWADEPRLKYGRQLLLGRGRQSWALGVEFETADAIYRCDEIKEATWRVNVFQGYWVKAAERYRQQMMSQWGMKPLSQQSPAWADKVRIVTTTWDDVKKLSQLVPRDSIAAFTTQGWLEGWNNGEMAKRGENYHPNFPLDNPVRWEGVKDSAQVFKKCEDLGVHVFPYTNGLCIDHQKHPWISQKIGDRHFWAWGPWQRIYPELCRDIVQRYGISAIYEDCSWVHGRHMLGDIDGDNWYNGSVHMREYFHEIVPQIALMGERNNEITARGQQFALGSITEDPHTHPICAYLFEPFVRMYNLNANAHAYDSEDIRGYTITNWMELPNTAEPMQEDLMKRKRGMVFAKEQLVSYWPEVWDPKVMHYFKGKDGTEYRFVRDNGTRFVKMVKDSPETIYCAHAALPSWRSPGWASKVGSAMRETGSSA